MESLEKEGSNHKSTEQAWSFGQRGTSTATNNKDHGQVNPGPLAIFFFNGFKDVRERDKCYKWEREKNIINEVRMWRLINN